MACEAGKSTVTMYWWFPGRARGNLHTTTWNTAEASREFPSTLLIDTRTEAQRPGQGELQGAIVIDRTVVSRVDRRGATAER